MIKVLVCDGRGTLGATQEEAVSLIEGLGRLGIKLAVITNGKRQQVVSSFSRRQLPSPDYIVARADTPSRKAKGSGEYVQKIIEHYKIEKSEVALLGDDDRTDFREAINAVVLPLRADYSPDHTPRSYGIPMEDIEYLIRYLALYCSHNKPYYGWMCNTDCADTKSYVDIRALVNQHSDIPQFEDLVKSRIPYQSATIGPRERLLGSIIENYLVTRLHLNDDLEVGHRTTICAYPGHTGELSNFLSNMAHDVPQVFNSTARNILIRHMPAPQSRRQGSNRNIYDQFRTIHVNPEERKRVEGKHVIVLDDFTTYGFSLETARRMLLKAGAKKVTCIAVGKWRYNSAITRISADWDPYAPCTLNQNDIQVSYVAGSASANADHAFHQMIDYLSTH